jgi:hypothetical protein
MTAQASWRQAVIIRQACAPPGLLTLPACATGRYGRGAFSPSHSSFGGSRMGQPVVHFEIGGRDRGRAEQFFGELFG